MITINLTGKVAVVTGGSRGIGLGICKTLGKAGAFVINVDILEDEGQHAVEMLKRDGMDACFHKADTTDVSSMKHLLKEITARHGSLDILVNNAAVMFRKAALEVTEEEYDHVMNVNQRALYFSCVSAGGIMKKQGHGSIINIVATSAMEAEGPLNTIYGLSKAGVKYLTEALAFEYAPYGVRVNAVAPGYVPTDMNREHYAAHPDELSALMRITPMGVPMSIGDIGNAVVFLASDLASHMTGHTTVVDGGLVLNFF